MNAALLLLTAAAAGVEPAPHPRPVRPAPPAAAVPDRLTVVFHARARPVRVIVAVTHAGKPLAEKWNAHIRGLFVGYDRDKNGFLNTVELDGIYPTAGIREMFGGGFYYRVTAQPPDMDEVDLNGDRQVSLGELQAYYGELAADVMRPRPIRTANTGPDAVTEVLFARLDRNRDGKLTRDEVRDAERVLARLDADEDECVSSNEVLTNRSSPEVAAMSTADAAMMMAAPKTEKPTPTAATDLAIYSSGVPVAALSAVLKRYDANRDAVLSPTEIGFTPEVFARLDVDRSGTLTASELDSWRASEPDAVVAIDMADTSAACKIVVTHPGGGPWPKEIDIRQTEPGRVVLRVGTQTVELGTHVPPESVRRRQAQELLTSAFPDGRIEVTEKDLVGPQFQLVRVVFEAADTNADGKLTRVEFEGYFARQRATADMALAVTFATRTPNLFQMLDDNLDGKLSARELQTAWDRLIVLEPGGATAVTRAAMQPSAALRVTPAAFVSVDATTFGPPTRAAQPTGPLWLRKMDRNGDGDVSQVEFLGDRATFDRLDTNGDRLISTAEAVAYDKTVRPPAKKSLPAAKK